MSFRAILATALMLFAVSLHGQKAPIKFGKVDPEEVKMTEYAADPSAEAVVLADYGVTTIEYQSGGGGGFYMIFNRHRRIKVLTKDGYNWADHEVAIYHNRNNEENVLGVKGATYNMEGNKMKVTKLNKKSVFKEKTNDNWDKVKFTMPNVKEGSVIEYSYSVRSPFFFNLHDWTFQTSIPTVWSEYITRLPEYFVYEMFMQGYHPMSVNQTTQTQDSFGGFVSGADARDNMYTRNDSRWVAKNVPAFRPEPFMSSINNYLSEVNFELAYVDFPGAKRQRFMGTWKDINDSYLKSQSFGDQLNNTPTIKEKVESLIAGATTAEEKIDRITSFVRGHMEWDGKYRTNTSQDLRKSYQEQEGSSADINLLLVNMFRKAGLESDPVVLSTRNHGILREEFPLSSQFNYVIAAVELPSGVVLLDATDKNLPNELLPPRCLNGRGLRVSKYKQDWVPLTQNSSAATMVSATLEIGEDGAIKGSADFRYSGYSAYNERKSYNKEGDEYESHIAGKYGWEIEKSQLNQVDELDKPVAAHYDLKTSHGLENLGNLIYLNPFISGTIEENPFKLDKRAFPVDFVNPNKDSYMMMLTVPEGYSIESIPKSEVVELPNGGGKYSYIIRQGGGQISLRSQLDINKAIFSGEEYEYLKAFYAKIVEKQAEQIVLKKN